MTLLDITVPIRPGMPVFEGDADVALHSVSSISEGGVCNLSRAEMSLHTGTHIDAPCHFIEGAGGVETTPVEALIGPCSIIDATGISGPHITAADIDRLVPPNARRVLFKTATSHLWDEQHFSPNFVALSGSAASALANRGILLAGIDYLSVAPYDDPVPSHVALLAAGVVILEGLDLRAASAGEYELICLPLLIPGADGAPARALLRSKL